MTGHTYTLGIICFLIFGYCYEIDYTFLIYVIFYNNKLNSYGLVELLANKRYNS